MCNISDDVQHKLSDFIMTGNQDGALMYLNVGELTPSVFLDQCWIEGNGGYSWAYTWC